MKSLFKVLSICALCLFAGVLAGPNDYADLNTAVFVAHNKARTNPQYFAQLAKDQLENKFVYDRSGNPTNTMCLAKDFIPKENVCYFTLTTFEGPKAWREATDVLNKRTEKLDYLKWSEGLSQACYDHIRDQGPKGNNGHVGSDGSGPSDRIKKYVTTMMTGENLAYSDVDNGEDVILQLIIDDGVPSRGHRKNIFEKDFTHMGVSCGCHTMYNEVCCIAYGKDVQEKDSNMQAFAAPTLNTCRAYDPLTYGDQTESFHIDPSVNSRETPQPKLIHPQVESSHSFKNSNLPNTLTPPGGRTQEKKQENRRQPTANQRERPTQNSNNQNAYYDFMYPDNFDQFMSFEHLFPGFQDNGQWQQWETSTYHEFTGYY
jgi:uncharacterized protein YkwD